jgi:hypothetical protein
MNTINMLTIYDVGKFFTRLYKSTSEDSGEYQRRYGRLRDCMEKCGLTRSLKQIEKIGSYPAGKILQTRELQAIHDRCIGMDDSVQAEVAEQTVLLLPKGTITQTLDEFRKLPVIMKPPTSLLDEVETCLYAGAYRSSIVMCWNVTYDYIRQWLFTNHPSELNAGLPKGKGPISRYSDFFKGPSQAPSEREVVELCSPKTLLGHKSAGMLRTLLDRRNDYAHPNFHDPTLAQANHYIDECFSVLNNTPFV